MKEKLNDTFKLLQGVTNQVEQQKNKLFKIVATAEMPEDQKEFFNESLNTLNTALGKNGTKDIEEVKKRLETLVNKGK